MHMYSGWGRLRVRSDTRTHDGAVLPPPSIAPDSDEDAQSDDERRASESSRGSRSFDL